MATIRVLSAEGRDTSWLRVAAAEQSTLLKDWIDDGAADDGGAFPTLVPAQALRALSAFAEQCVAAFASGGEVARDAAASEWAAQERPFAELACLLSGVHFLDMPHARQAVSRAFCAHLAAATCPDELAALLGAACDLSDEERQAALSESIFEPDAPDATAQAPAMPQPPPLAPSVSSLLNDDAVEEALSVADVPTLRMLKGVSRGWRASARRVLWARLCRLEGRPLPKALLTSLRLTSGHSLRRMGRACRT